MTAPRRTLHVTVEHVSGSVQHYFHFLLGFFAPLVYSLSTSWAGRPVDELLVRSCGPFDRLIAELGDPRIRVLDSKQHRQLARVAGPGEAIEAVTIRGYDDPARYDHATFAVVRDALQRRQAVLDETRSVEGAWPGGESRVLLVDRGPSPPFYGSDQSEVKTSGSERRSIPNFAELYRSLEREHRGCLTVVPEELPLARQIALFATADIVVAQHGAALANLIWARPDATVVEIYPDDVRADFFGDLAWCLGLRHRRLRQQHSHAEVDPDELRAVVRESIDHPDHPLAARLRRLTFRPMRMTVAARGRAANSLSHMDTLSRVRRRGGALVIHLRGRSAEKALRPHRPVTQLPPVHVFHIGKTGGTALKHALNDHRIGRYELLLQGHQVTLADVPAGERFMFVIRDPIARFVSAFNGRLREDRPRYDYPWNDAEREAFSVFTTPDQLATALSASDPEERHRAERAMRGIGHVNTSYWTWFGDEATFRSRLGDLFFIAFQERLSDDFELLKRKLGLPPEVRLPPDETVAHRTPNGFAVELSPVARSNLERWYARDRAFFELCHELASRVNVAA